MAKTSYEQRSSAKAQAIVNAIFDIGGIGYVALNSGWESLETFLLKAKEPIRTP
ncbi:MAG: hypothetical protein WAU91_21690 [Desulfatitalea sp.]